MGAKNKMGAKSKNHAFYAEGYARDIEVGLFDDPKTKMRFKFDCDLKGFGISEKGSRPLYAMTRGMAGPENAYAYKVGSEADSFSTHFYDGCLISNKPLHIGVFFEPKGKEKETAAEAYIVRRFKILD